MLKDNLKDAAQIIRNIITQPLEVPGGNENASLLKAAQDYHPSQGTSSDLAKILKTFADYPNSTERLISELDFILMEFLRLRRHFV